MVWLPAPNVGEGVHATWNDPLIATPTQPAMSTPPSLKVTLPVGEPTAGAVTPTVALNVTDCPVNAGFCEEVTPVVVFALLTVTEPEHALLLSLVSRTLRFGSTAQTPAARGFPNVPMAVGVEVVDTRKPPEAAIVTLPPLAEHVNVEVVMLQLIVPV